MALVKVRFNRTGKIKTMAKRYADILVKRGKAKIVDIEAVFEAKPLVLKEKVAKEKPLKDKKTKDLKAETGEKKKPGRPAKQTYKTKDMVAE